MPYNLNLPEQFNAADYFIDRNIREGRANKTAVLCEERAFTYGQLQENVNRFGNASNPSMSAWKNGSHCSSWTRKFIPRPFSAPSRSARPHLSQYHEPLQGFRILSQ